MPKTKTDINTSSNELADALIQAMEAVKPPAKKTPFNRKKNTPWSPKDGAPQVKMKRKYYHHALQIQDNVSNEEIELLNRLRPGVYCDGFIKVIRRKDRGIDIDYPVKTAAHRLKLINQYGVRDFKELLTLLVNEAANPKKVDDIDED